MIELIDFMMQHFSLGVTLNMLVGHIQTPKLIIYQHFIKIQFVNKGIEFNNSPSIFKDKSVISSIPTYFENKEFSMICYKYKKNYS